MALDAQREHPEMHLYLNPENNVARRTLGDRGKPCTLTTWKTHRRHRLINIRKAEGEGG